MSIDVYYGNDKVGELDLTKIALDLAEARLSANHKKDDPPKFGIKFQYGLKKDGTAEIKQANLAGLNQ